VGVNYLPPTQRALSANCSGTIFSILTTLFIFRLLLKTEYFGTG